MNKSDSGNVPHTIDSAGNIVPKPNGVSRWASPRVYGCTHKDCTSAAVVCTPHSRLETEGAHNCCSKHDHIANTDMVMRIVDKIVVRDAHILQRLAEIEAAE